MLLLLQLMLPKIIDAPKEMTILRIRKLSIMGVMGLWMDKALTTTMAVLPEYSLVIGKGYCGPDGALLRC
jgi:hypothetical protein